jgi:outer membrane protein assembly factor BamB
MGRRRGWAIGIGLAIALLAVHPAAQAFIEKLTHLSDLIVQADYIFVAKVESVDPAKPAAVLTIQQDLKGKPAFRRIPINLTGDKEKHTPHLLRRIAADVPLVVFVTEQDKNQLVLAYTNGCWFQIIGQADGQATRWAFTHIEIYLRRTFKGTTAEMQQAVTDALAGKKKPPPADPKEPAGFGPELETKPNAQQGESASPDDVFLPPLLRGGEDKGLRGTPSLFGASSTLLGVIALPFLMPIAALLQLLFPGLLRDQWRQYQIAVAILLSQSTLLMMHWIICKWVVADAGAHWWLSPAFAWIALVALAVIGAALAFVRHVRRQPVPVKPPVRVEYLALGTLLLAGIGWAVYQWYASGTPLRDAIAVVTAAAALMGIVHLVIRRVRTGNGVERRAILTTELVFLLSLVLAGTGLGMYLHRPAPANLEASAVTAEWNMARGNERRTGALDANDPGPRRPVVLWSFDPGERKGRVHFHSSPTYVNGQLYIGAMHEVLAFTQGLVYCINAADGRQVGDAPIVVGQRLWRFNADATLKPVFSTPIVHGGRIYFGEGYHQDSQCRLFCLDARSGDRALWAKRTASHVESSPAVVGTRVYFGAGDDGLLCVDAGVLENGLEDMPSPKVVWHVPNIHVDASPLVVDNRVFVGTIVGDVHQTLEAVAVDAKTGQVLWRTPAPLPLTGSPAYAGGRVFFGLGNGKLNRDADEPAGALWCLDAASGRRLWEYPVGNSVFGAPALMNEHVYFGSADGYFYWLRQADGKLLWKVNMQSPIAAAPVVAGGKVYVLTATGVLACLNAADGAELWRLDDLADGVTDAFASPVLAHGRLYVAMGGKVYCVGDRE